LAALDGAVQCALASHTKPSTQSSTEAQEERQVLPSQLNGEQSEGSPFGAVTVWAPSQVAPETHLLEATSQVLPAAQSASAAQLLWHALPSTSHT